MRKGEAEFWAGAGLIFSQLFSIVRCHEASKPLPTRHSPRQREFFTSIVSSMFVAMKVSYGREGCEYNTCFDRE
nr:MAG TPA: hypothetical protein [Caudoviricetes sp.]